MAPSPIQRRRALNALGIAGYADRQRVAREAKEKKAALTRVSIFNMPSHRLFGVRIEGPQGWVRIAGLTYSEARSLYKKCGDE